MTQAMSDEALDHQIVTLERFGPAFSAEWQRQQKALRRLRWTGKRWERRS